MAEGYQRRAQWPSLEWLLDRAIEGTTVTHAIRMMREEGYGMSHELFRHVYKAVLNWRTNRCAYLRRRRRRRAIKW